MLVIVIDDVAHADVLAVDTPSIDLLAAQGLTFERAYANPVCVLSRRSLTFGRFWIDARGPHCEPPDRFTPGALPSLPRLARTLGLHTALFGKWHVTTRPDGRYPLAPQFHGYETWRAGLVTNSAESRCGGFGDYWDWSRVEDGVVFQSDEYVDVAIRDRFLAWWHAQRGPRFAVVSFQNAHEPFHEPPAELLPPGTPPAATLRGRFEHQIQALDTLIGQVLAVAGPEDVVLLLGDNGTPQDVAPERFRAKTTTFERGIHVPFLVRAPFVAPGGVTRALVHVADVLPTLAELAGRRFGHGHGVSFLPVLLDPTRATREYVVSGYQQHRRASHTHGDVEAKLDVCIRSERYKLRVDKDGNEELYDLDADPEERTPLDLADPALADVLAWHRERLADVRRTL